ncbi:regulator of G-protein signaling 22 [Indicator indicator]|uniref:regulator of G-protein signaling 22 n=1 Tax=Indicator indicator TaxID=1002788 RepID=UPI0023E01227|nr:regulator of G-protein signaling 22 [Indicator indicator]
MQSKRITTEPPSITEEVFEECLATDDMFVDYFNEFLSLPTFAQPVKFNSDFGVFEVVNDAPQHLESQLKKNLHDQKSPNLIYNVLRKAKDDGQTSKLRSASPALAVDPNDTTMYLDREQAMQWIKEERLPAFLESDCYFEYRLAKLISQVEWSKTGINFIIDSDYYPWRRKQDPGSPSLGEDDSLLTLKKFGQAKQSESRNTTYTFLHPPDPGQIQDTQCLPGQHVKESFLEPGSLSDECHQQGFLSPSRPASPKAQIIKERYREDEEDFFVAITESPSHNQLRVYLDPKWDNAPKEENGHKSTTLTAKTFLPAHVQSVMKEAVSELTQQTAADIGTSNEFAHRTEQDTEEVSLRSGSESDGADSRAAWCVSHRTYDTGNRHQFERFKKFIKGTLGERYWWLWMDIERLKALKDTTRQQRQLSKMKTLYLLSSGDYCLSSEVLLRLNLLHGDQWNINHLRWIQPEIVKPLLLYWGPRFCVTHSTAIETASAKLKLWYTCQERPRVDIDPFPQIVSLVPWTPKSCIPGIPPSLPQISSGLSPTLPSDQSPPRDISSSRMWPEPMSRDMIHCLGLEDTEVSGYQGQRKYTYAELLSGYSAAGSVVVGGSRMESMLQSLYLENRAGYHFTQFCEKSGNKLWKNSVYFWFDLQAYQQLFYQETLHPFKICKQAQFLYATYIAPSASMDIGLHQSKKNMIYQKIDPAFEDLFDPAEEYVLTVLLEPWMKMMEADKDTYGKVELVEEAQQLDSVYFRKLQALHHESGSKKDESTVADTALLPCPGALKEDQHSGQIPKELAGPQLSDLIHDKEKLEQFRAFLSEHSAGMDLMCWLDIEQFRKMLHQDKEKREEKSEKIQSKYFNEKYLFGPNSPASREQKEQLMRSGGGWGQIPHDQFSAAVLLEVQQCVQKRLEKQWLPLFLAEEHRGAHRRAKHVDTQWLSSPSDIIAFRQALLNPVTAKEFQCFLSLRGDLLENGVLFWQEVQKYKDLCHSHCDDATVQKKITAIIDRFINSAIPPALQIDIPAEQAKKILEHRKELGPYIFREAQMTVFALLFKFWPKFSKFRSNADSDKILLALERERSKRMRKKEWKTAEEKLAKFQSKEVERKLSSLAGSASANETGMERGLASFSDGYGQQASWSFSKYIEALEQERILLKMQEDLEKNSSSLLTGSPSVSFPKPENSEKSNTSSRTSVTLKKHSVPLKKQVFNKVLSLQHFGLIPNTRVYTFYLPAVN